ncbi:MAG: hypothetical protein U9Q79_01175 [Candidatus Hydrogenedentes bacterium]|nr:hypothetical protein [Candidatus Hydrogenedentota bacterium]
MSKQYLKKTKFSLSARLITADALIIAALIAYPAAACDIPVYEWALLNWAPDTYELLIFHEQPLEAGITSALEALDTEKSPENAKLNVETRRIAAGPAMEAADAHVWERDNPGDSPWMALRYPGMPPDFPSLWVGKASPEEIQRLSDSPARHSIAKALIQPVSHVWVLLKCGNEQKDTEARERLEAGLARIPDMLDPETISPNAAITHATVEVDRDDPAEAVLVHTLLRSEPDLMGYDEPMVFPVFGRGRALYALVGAGINAENILDACVYIAGRCSCLVKDENPGVDLLLAADWSSMASATSAAVIVPQVSDTYSDTPAEPLPPSAHPGRYILAGLGGAFILMVGLSALVLRKTFS